jgi:hypothetical protein
VETILRVVIALGLVGALVVQVTVLLRLPSERSGDRRREQRRLLLQALAVAGVLIAVGVTGWLLRR